MDYEKEIEDILNNISHTEYKSLKSIEEIRNEKIYSLYHKFMKYEKNIKNIEYTFNELSKYEYVDDIHTLKIGNVIRFINKTNFFDMQLYNSCVILKIDYKPKGNIVCKQGNYIKTIRNNHAIFRLIPEETLIKMKLLEMVE